jgi:hypothetical protein
LGPELNAQEYSEKAGNFNDRLYCACYWRQFLLTLVFSTTHCTWTVVTVRCRRVNHFHSDTPLHKMQIGIFVCIMRGTHNQSSVFTNLSVVGIILQHFVSGTLSLSVHNLSLYAFLMFKISPLCRHHTWFCFEY